MNNVHNVSSVPVYPETAFKRSGLALKAARLQQGLTRKEAAQLCGCSHQNFEQIENARTKFSETRLQTLVEKIGCTWSDFLSIREDPYLILRKLADSNHKNREPKPRRNTFKYITKQARVLKILRMRKRISQCKASELCGYSKCTFGQIENGRIELPLDRVRSILDCLGLSYSEFEMHMKSSVLKDEVLLECQRSLTQLSDDKLESAHIIIKSLLKA